MFHPSTPADKLVLDLLVALATWSRGPEDRKGIEFVKRRYNNTPHLYLGSRGADLASAQRVAIRG